MRTERDGTPRYGANGLRSSTSRESAVAYSETRSGAGLARLQAGANRGKQRCDSWTQREQGDECCNGYAGEDEAVLNKALALFTLRYVASKHGHELVPHGLYLPLRSSCRFF